MRIYSYLKNIFRKGRRNTILEAVENSAWFRRVVCCQDEIATSEPHPHYLKAYRDSEIWYWFHVPEWIDSLAKTDMPVKRVLDIGGAYGTLALYCKQTFDCEIYMTDFTDILLSQTFRGNNGIEFAVNDIEREPFPWDMQFDLIVFTEVLEHLNFKPKPTLRKIRDLLKDNGKLFLTTPDAAEWGRTKKYYRSLDSIPSYSEDLPVIDDHVWQYNQKELTSLLTECGFEIEKFDYAPGLPRRHFNLQLKKVKATP